MYIGVLGMIKKQKLDKGIDDKLQFIIDIVKGLVDVPLSSKCGKYYALVYNGVSVVALKYISAKGYGTAYLGKLSPRIINVIYDDLREDFNG